MKASELLGPGSLQRMQSRLGRPGAELLEERWKKLQKEHNLEIKGRIDLGVQAAILKVEWKEKPAILKICTLPNIFQGQEAALRLAPKGTVPEIFYSFPREEAWLMEILEGAPGRRGLFDFDRGEGVLCSFHKGKTGDGLFDLVGYHFSIARRIKESRTLQYEEAFCDLSKNGQIGLVHGDPIPENIISLEDKSWLIDPTGFVGDQAFDWATLALYSKNPVESLSRAGQKFGEERVFAWAWLRASLSAEQAEAAGDLEDAKPLLDIIPSLSSRVSWLKSSL